MLYNNIQNTIFISLIRRTSLETFMILILASSTTVT